MVAENRVKITCNDKGELLHNGNPVKIVLRKDMIMIGCTDITINAAELLMKKHREVFSDGAEFVLQSGKRDVQN